MYKKMQELRNKHEEGKDRQEQREDEEILAMSGLAIYVGKLLYRNAENPLYEWL